MTSKKLLFLIFQNLVFSKDHRRGGYLRRRLPLLLCPRVGQQVLQKMAPPAQSPQAASPHQHLHRGGGLQGFGTAFIFCGSGSSSSSQCGSGYGSSFKKKFIKRWNVFWSWKRQKRLLKTQKLTIELVQIYSIKKITNYQLPIFHSWALLLLKVNSVKR